MNHPTDEGVTKFTLNHSECDLDAEYSITELDRIRTMLFDDGLVGTDEFGIGFGNVSIKCHGGFLISGTGTGGVRCLGASGYCLVTQCDITCNSVCSVGPTAPSSESMSHGAIYAARDDIGSVIHGHSHSLWSALISAKFPATPDKVAYGTTAMAASVKEIVAYTATPFGLFVMAGHQDGLIAYGRNIVEAYKQISHALTLAH
jgi:ribulose-5-phosphate 4-epimerase/fuculose-1-phosphate aldolase